MNQDLIASLGQKSVKRVTENSDFQKTQTNIKEYVDRKSRKTVTLNEAKLRDEREKDKDKKNKKTDDPDDETPKADGPIFPDTGYNNEVLNIAVDYVEFLRRAATAQR